MDNLYNDLQDFLIMPPKEGFKEENELIFSIYDHFRELGTQVKMEGGLVEILQDPKIGMNVVFKNKKNGRMSRLTEFIRKEKEKGKVQGSFLHCVYYFIQSLYDTCHKAIFIKNCYAAEGEEAKI